MTLVSGQFLRAVLVRSAILGPPEAVGMVIWMEDEGEVPEEESEEEPMRSLSPERSFVPWEESEDSDPEEELDDPRPGKSWRSSTLVGAVRADGGQGEEDEGVSDIDR